MSFQASRVVVTPLGAIITVVVQDGQTEDDAIASVINSNPGSVAVIGWVPGAIIRASFPPQGAVIAVQEFQRRILPARYNLYSLSPEIRTKWTDLLKILTSFDTIDLRDTNLANLMQAAIADNVITQEQANGILSYA